MPKLVFGSTTLGTWQVAMQTVARSWRAPSCTAINDSNSAEVRRRLPRGASTPAPSPTMVGAHPGLVLQHPLSQSRWYAHSRRPPHRRPTTHMPQLEPGRGGRGPVVRPGVLSWGSVHVLQAGTGPDHATNSPQIHVDSLSLPPQLRPCAIPCQRRTVYAQRATHSLKCQLRNFVCLDDGLGKLGRRALRRHGRFA
eukprot:362907-Chlamydomonas_euryale.AAC.15